jgi:urease subunit beta
MIPGEYILSSDPIVANEGRDQTAVLVRHTGDRPIQVGSHYHFFEVNRASISIATKHSACVSTFPPEPECDLSPGKKSRSHWSPSEDCAAFLDTREK